MSDFSAAVVSSDDRFAVAIAGALEREFGVLTATIKPHAWDQLDVGDEPAAVHLIDLRSADSWRWLHDLHLDRIAGRRPMPNLVGIVEDRIPLVWAGAADHCLRSVVRWRWQGGDFSTAIRHLVTAAPGHSEVPAGVPREIHGGKYRFRTFTPALFSLVEHLEVVARRNFSVLLVGETGTGKTTLARLIHDLSPRRDMPFVTVACGAMPSELIESELFGHVRGAFTGADRTKEGKFDVASGGTILLDEIDVLGTLQQAKLLQVLETGEYEAVGSNSTKRADVRTIVASNVCLEARMAQQEFRPDLYFRLNQCKFEIPPLRERRWDVVPLAVEFIEDYAREHDLSVEGLEPELLAMLRSYAWPGNVRELRNEMRRAAAFCCDGTLRAAALSSDLQRKVAQYRREIPAALSRPGLSGEVAKCEQEAIEDMLRAQNFNRAATARALGISRVTLYNKIRKYSIRMDQPEHQG